MTDRTEREELTEALIRDRAWQGRTHGVAAVRLLCGLLDAARAEAERLRDKCGEEYGRRVSVEMACDKAEDALVEARAEADTQRKDAASAREKMGHNAANLDFCIQERMRLEAALAAAEKERDTAIEAMRRWKDEAERLSRVLIAREALAAGTSVEKKVVYIIVDSAVQTVAIAETRHTAESYVEDNQPNTWEVQKMKLLTEWPVGDICLHNNNPSGWPDDACPGCGKSFTELSRIRLQEDDQ